MSQTNKYVILHGKFGRLEGKPAELVTKKPGDILDMTAEHAQAHQDRVRLATPDEIAAYEARLRGEVAPAPIPVEHVSTAGAPPQPTPAADPLQPPATPEQPPQRHFPPPAATVAPAVPAATTTPTPAIPSAAPATPSARESSGQAAANRQTAADRAPAEGKPKARGGAKAKGSGGAKSSTKGGRK